MYAFLFDKKSLILVALGCFLGGLLLFAAGWTMGAHLGAERQPDSTLTATHPGDGFEHLLSSSDAAPQSSSSLTAQPGALSADPSPSASDGAQPTQRPTPALPSAPSAAEPSAAEPSIAEPSAAEPSAAEPPAEEASPSESSGSATGTGEPSFAGGYGDQVAVGNPAEGGFVVQAGTFRRQSNAERRVEELEGHGYRPFIEVIHKNRGGLLYTVRVGFYASEGLAEEVAVLMRRQLGLPPDEGWEIRVFQTSADAA